MKTLSVIEHTAQRRHGAGDRLCWQSIGSDSVLVSRSRMELIRGFASAASPWANMPSETPFHNPTGNDRA